VSMVTTEGPAEHPYPGQALGLPDSGVGSVAGMGRRIAAFVIDIALSAMLAWAFTAPEPPQNASLFVWAALTVVTVGLFGFSPGQAALGIRVVPIRGGSFVGLWAVPRTLLIFVIVPPLLINEDSRGLHDRICRTIVLRTR
jgi:uncharacterized RDD family membrane protein YckC